MIDWGKISGTPFQKRVWQATCAIPAGETRSYREIARSIGQPKAYRAVAQALKRNPYAPMIPCHRVIRSDGHLGGYSGAGGLRRKRELLKAETV